jgi:hypothetical protein
MKKFVIQDVQDKMYYADNGQWTEYVEDALHFILEKEAWDTACTLNNDTDYILTVIPILY